LSGIVARSGVKLQLPFLLRVECGVEQPLLILDGPLDIANGRQVFVEHLAVDMTSDLSYVRSPIWSAIIWSIDCRGQVKGEPVRNESSASWLSEMPELT
jgi:hypothetical protein